jgi:inhibitor of the pro-sigma K processing machinery
MSLLVTTLLLLGGVLALVALVRFFLSPLRAVTKLLLNTALGFLGLLLLQRFGGYIGLSLGVNLVNALVIGSLGLPGLGLLLMLKWIFQV